MGYILPLVPLLSMQDSNLQIAKQKRYSHIVSVEPVNKQSGFEKEVTRKLDNYYPFKNAREDNMTLPISSHKQDLAQEIAEVTGKGRIINYYV